MSDTAEELMSRARIRAELESREAPRRLNAATVLQMLHDERMAQATKPSREDRPRITLKRSTASGSLGVVGIDVDVPVCEEFPSSAEAQAEAMRLMDELAARYPMPDRNGGTK